MGGIKNKLSKLSNKVKNLFNKATNLPPLLGETDENRRFSIGGVNKQDLLGKVNNKGSRLPSFSQPSKMPDGQISNTRKLNYLGLYAEKTIGSLRPTFQSLPLAKGRQMSVAHRWGRTAKYLGIACLLFAILSTLVLNIVSSYSYSSIHTNAVDDSSNANNTSTLADNDTTSISLSFANLSTGSNDPNISLTIPRGGGIATGGHTVTVQTNASRGYNVTLLADSSQLSSGSSDFTFDSASGTLASPQPLGDNQWGIAIPGQNGFNNDVSDYQSADSQILQTTKWAAMPTSGYVNDRIIMKSSSATSDAGDSQVVMYGANCVGFVLAGSYSNNVTYTATAFVQAAPSLDRFDTGNDTTYAGKTDQFILHGRNLNNIQSLWIDYNDNGVHDDNETATIDDTATDKDQVTFTNAPSDHIGMHDVYIETLGGVDRLEQSFIIQPASICRSGDPNNDCQVDIDDNMIPVKYDDANSALEHPIWTTIASREDGNNLGDWYDYDQQKWANAITVKEEALDKYKGKDGVEVDNDDVLGYWVYIPRYAYEVQRRDAMDGVVNNGSGNIPGNNNRFIVEFETVSDIKKYPAKGCSNPEWYTDVPGTSGLLKGVKDYRKECGLNRLYGNGDGDDNNTTWATHPAFTFGDEELNGIWVSKFYSVPTASDDGVSMVNKPNTIVSPLKIAEEVGVGSASSLYYASKLVGQTDPNNTGGTADVAMAENSNNLHGYTSHLAKNKDWGAIVYLAYSRYGLNKMTGVDANYAILPAKFDYVFGWGGLVTGCGGYSKEESDQLNNSPMDAYPNDETMTTAICSASDVEKQYNGDRGVLSSTTHNVYGVYDLIGTVGNLVAATMVDDDANPNNLLIDEPYADVYHYGGNLSFGLRPIWWPDYSEEGYDPSTFYDTCTYELCGGQAIHEGIIAMPLWGFIYTWSDQLAHTTSSLEFPASLSGFSEYLGTRGLNSDGFPSLFAGHSVNGFDTQGASTVEEFIEFYAHTASALPRIVIKPEAGN